MCFSKDLTFIVTSNILTLYDNTLCVSGLQHPFLYIVECYVSVTQASMVTCPSLSEHHGRDRPGSGLLLCLSRAPHIEGTALSGSHGALPPPLGQRCPSPLGGGSCPLTCHRGLGWVCDVVRLTVASRWPCFQRVRGHRPCVCWTLGYTWPRPDPGSHLHTTSDTLGSFCPTHVDTLGRPVPHHQAWEGAGLGVGDPQAEDVGDRLQQA